jgi:hypothetical protein
MRFEGALFVTQAAGRLLLLKVSVMGRFLLHCGSNDHFTLLLTAVADGQNAALKQNTSRLRSIFHELSASMDQSRIAIWR